jgi:hypothetical protein
MNQLNKAYGPPPIQPKENEGGKQQSKFISKTIEQLHKDFQLPTKPLVIFSQKRLVRRNY